MTNEIVVEPSIITREYNAPMQLVFEAWTQEEHLCKWQVPNNDIRCEYKFANISAGGSSLHKMTMPNGHEMWLLTKYEEITAPDTIVFFQYESNSDGEILPPSMPNWPKELRATIKLEEKDGLTLMKFIWQPVNITKEEAEAWEVSRPQHSKGWGGGFDMLGNYLQTLL